MIVKVEPVDAEHAPVALVSSDAPDNDGAIRDIDRWASDHGFVRSREYHLNTRVTDDGRLLRFSACYRLTPQDARSADEHLARIRSRRESMPETVSSAVLLRED